MQIRKIKPEEYPILNDILYEAIYQPDANNIIPRTVLMVPEVAVFIKDFGQWPHDYCLVAEKEDKIIGAVWVRVINGDIKGYGFIDDHTPEFGIALFPEYRNKGIGTALMQEMIEYLRKKGYRQTSLSVHKGNKAIRLYRKLGFETVEDRKEDFLMLLKL